MTKSKRIGINAGYIKKLALTSPLISKTKLRCMPQPGQSIWVICLNGQGSWCASNQLVIFNRMLNINSFGFGVLSYVLNADTNNQLLITNASISTGKQNPLCTWITGEDTFTCFLFII